MILKELEIGDKFFNVKDPDEKWIVRGNITKNKHNFAIRICVKCSNNTLYRKSCNIEVEKIGESKHKDAMKKNPVNFI